MKTKLQQLIIFMTLLSVAACQFQNMSGLKKQKNKNQVTYDQIATLKPKHSTNLMAGEYLDVGDVNIYCDDENVFIEYETTDDWFLRNIHLYVGDLEFIPTDKNELPNPNRFPIRTVCPNQTQSKIYVVSKSILPENFAVSAHAEVKREVNGIETKTETAWCEGDHFSTHGNGMYFNVSKFNNFDKDYVSL